MTGRGERPSLAVVGYLILSGAVILALFAFWENNRSIEQARLERVDAVNKVISENCREIEELKALQRAEAREAFREAKDNARVLGIAFTTELQKRLKEELAESLRDYQMRPCPREPIPDQ